MLGNRALCVDMDIAVLHALADRFLVNIEPDVMDTMHRGVPLPVSEIARSLSSAFWGLALLHRLFVRIHQEFESEAWVSFVVKR